MRKEAAVTLNAKAAMVICAGCIGGMSWLVQQTTVQGAETTAPLVVTDMPLDDVLRARSQRGPALVRGLDPQEGWAERFAKANAMDRQADANRTAEKGLAFVTASPQQAGSLQPVTLPPLANEAVQAQFLADRLPDDTVAVLTSASTEPREAAVSEPLPAEATFRSYRVAKGDTLARIARRECRSRDPQLLAVLLEHNPAVAGRNGRLLAGEELSIPDAATAVQLVAASAAGGKGGAASGMGSVASSATKSETAGERWYTIQRNDSLQSIAKRLLDDAGRWREILKLNRSLDPHKILPGARIKLPPALRLAAR